MLKTTANKITLLRVILVPVYMVLAYAGQMIPAFVVYVIACLSDFADGYIARNYDQVSDFGKFMDPLADKMLVVAAMCCFVDSGQIPGWMVAVVIFREFAVSGLRLIAVEKGRVIAAARSGKIKTFCTMICLGAMMIFPESHFLSTLSCILILTTTLVSGAEYFIRNRDVFNAE